MTIPIPAPKADDVYTITTSDIRWDKITFQWYGSFDRMQDVKNANPYIPLSIKQRSYVPSNTVVYKPLDSETQDSNIGVQPWRAQ